MAHGATTALKVATVAAIFMVLVLTSEGESHDCISRCPSKCRATAKHTCAGYKTGGSRVCLIDCTDGCHSSCASACNNSSRPACAPGEEEACHSTCQGKCDKKCGDQPRAEYKPCLSQVSEGCKKDCEAGCKGEKVQG